MDTQYLERAAKIAAANDAFRSTSQKDVYFAGELAQEPLFCQLLVLNKVRRLQPEDFSSESPERDFVSMAYGDRTVFAKIDNYDATMEGGLDPLDPACRRVLTIFYAEDY